MENAAVFTVLSRCFAHVDETEWAAITEPSLWEDFLASARRLLQDEGTSPERLAPLARARKAEPLEDFLTDDEVRALYAPPAARELASFGARHFTGGLPASAVPVESLYVEWTDRAETSPFGHAEGLYDSDAALYMRDLISSMGIGADAAIEPYPDHLAVELDLATLLFASGRDADAWRFVDERFAWLSSYRSRLLEIGAEALFHVAIVDLVLGIRAMQATEADTID